MQQAQRSATCRVLAPRLCVALGRAVAGLAPAAQVAAAAALELWAAEVGDRPAARRRGSCFSRSQRVPWKPPGLVHRFMKVIASLPENQGGERPKMLEENGLLGPFSGLIFKAVFVLGGPLKSWMIYTDVSRCITCGNGPLCWAASTAQAA